MRFFFISRCPFLTSSLHYRRHHSISCTHKNNTLHHSDHGNFWRRHLILLINCTHPKSHCIHPYKDDKWSQHAPHNLTWARSNHEVFLDHGMHDLPDLSDKHQTLAEVSSHNTLFCKTYFFIVIASKYSCPFSWTFFQSRLARFLCWARFYLLLLAT